MGTATIDKSQPPICDRHYTVSEKVLAEWARAVANRLEGAAGPVSAKKLAVVCGVNGSHETVRRRVREAVTYGRESFGLRFCANGSGYWLARDAGEWEAYRQAVAGGARFKFVALRRMQTAVTDRMNRQGRFDFVGICTR